MFKTFQIKLIIILSPCWVMQRSYLCTFGIEISSASSKPLEIIKVYRENTAELKWKGLNMNRTYLTKVISDPLELSSHVFIWPFAWYFFLFFVSSVFTFFFFGQGST